MISVIISAEQTEPFHFTLPNNHNQKLPTKRPKYIAIHFYAHLKPNKYNIGGIADSWHVNDDLSAMGYRPKLSVTQRCDVPKAESRIPIEIVVERLLQFEYFFIGSKFLKVAFWNRTGVVLLPIGNR